MASAIDEAQVRHIAKLSRLKLTGAEVHLFAGQLAAILDYVRQLESVDAAGVEPLAHPLPAVNVVRADEPGVPLDSAQALANAPERTGRLFKVPAVLDPSAGA